jgi:hypothetical protein
MYLPIIFRKKASNFSGPTFWRWSLKLSCFLVHFKEKVASHQNEGFETPVDAAKEFACGSVATVTDLGEALGVDLEASEKEIGAAAEINVLLNLYGDLLVVREEWCLR